jgi:hypothetical protein
VPINPVPTSPQITDSKGVLVPIYQAFISSIYNWLSPVGQSGPTSQRPVAAVNVFMYVGRSYFDTTLGIPIWVKSLNPTVWINASGGVV